MGTNMKVQELLDSRSSYLDEIIKNLKSWDGSIESGIDIIRANDLKVEELKSLDRKLSSLPETAYADDKYEERLKLILEDQRVFLGRLKEKQKNLLRKIKTLNQRNRIVKGYAHNQGDSIFIDKDL